MPVTRSYRRRSISWKSRNYRSTPTHPWPSLPFANCTLGGSQILPRPMFWVSQPLFSILPTPSLCRIFNCGYAHTDSGRAMAFHHATSPNTPKYNLISHSQSIPSDRPFRESRNNKHLGQHCRANGTSRRRTDWSNSKATIRAMMEVDSNLR